MAATEPDTLTERPRRRRRLVLVLAALLVASLVAAAGILSVIPPQGARPRPIADVSSERLLAQGPVVGFASEYETHAWLGLPFARPPVGPLRWRAPQPPETWVDTRDALEFARPCVQPGSPIAGVPAEDEDGLAGDEDCLYLNVWAPRFEPDAVPTGRDRIPVMVWIHGGGNTRGWTGSAMYDGARLAGTQDLLVVSVGYRLGPLGWFSHAALRAEAEDALEASGNFGTLDQIAALEWVQAHIDEFGGDPDNVTIFGESAGGTNVYALLLSPAAEGLFHRAVPQSGTTRSYSRIEAEHPHGDAQPGHPASSAEAVVRLLVGAGAVPDEEAARGYAAVLGPEDLLAFLRARGAREVLRAYRDPDSPGRLELPKPIRDGALLPRGDWLAELAEGRFHRVPVLAGANRDEWKLFLALDDRHVRRRFGAFFRIRDPEDYERRARLLSERRIVQGVNAPLSAMQRAGHDALFAYRFDYDALPRLFGQDLSVLIGAGHGLELPLLFGSFDVGNPLMSRAFYREEGQAEREQLAEGMRRYWAAFARDGRPGRGVDGQLPEWRPWADGRIGDGGRWMLIDDAASGGFRMASTQLDRDAVVAKVTGDPALEGALRCELYLDVFRDQPGWWRAEDYAALRTRPCPTLGEL